MSQDMRVTQILELEEYLLQQEVRLDEATLTALLADDFVEFGASGHAWTKADVITGLLSEVFTARRIEDFKLRTLGADVVLATYRCGCLSAEGGETFSLRSSIWRKHLDSWQMVFHQGTKIAA